MSNYSSWKSYLDTEKQMGRFNRECGEVETYYVNPEVFKQDPVAVVDVNELIQEQKMQKAIDKFERDVEEYHNVVFS